MKWVKRGRIFVRETTEGWWYSHCQAPAPILISESIIRVFFGAWDANGISRVNYVDVDSEDPGKVLYVSDEPVLDLGQPGTFDENGIVPMGVGRVGDKIHLYYTGFQLGHKVSYYMMGGVAVSHDNGQTFRRVSGAPMLDRSDEGLTTRGGPTIICENNVVKMWYSAGTKFEDIGGKPRPTYDIFYQESFDGLCAKSMGSLCLKYDRETEHGLGRPQVSKVNGKYVMFHTVRTRDMRYNFGCALSDDGLHWDRVPHGIDFSDNGWDSKMMYFPYLIQSKGKSFLFYNGNNFGETGFGYAELESW
jgi:hypothetical protein